MEGKSKIRIRPIEPSDAKSIAAILSNKEVLETLDAKHPFPVPINYVRDKIPQDEENWKTGRAYKFIIIKNKEIAGQISLYNPNRNRGSYELGYFIGRDFWNQGVATEAVKQICKFGFDELKLKKIWSSVSKGNPASMRVLEKSGFEVASKDRTEFRLVIKIEK